MAALARLQLPADGLPLGITLYFYFDYIFTSMTNLQKNYILVQIFTLLSMLFQKYQLYYFKTAQNLCGSDSKLTLHQDEACFMLSI